MFFFVSLLPVLVFCLPQPFASEFPNLTCTPVGTGLSARVPLCTPALPCVHLLASYAALGITTINVSDFGAPNSLPLSLGSSQQCSTRPAISPASDARNDGALSSLVVEGMTRYFCQFAPAGQGLPLLIDFPGSGGFARNAYTTTRFRQKAETEVIKPGVTGYVFVSMSPLNRHWPPSGLIGPTEDGAKQDFLYRNYSDNEDVKFIDELINSLVSSGKVDQRYIFLSGHSNGAQFAHFYGIVRASIPSKHGHRVAAGNCKNSINQKFSEILQNSIQSPLFLEQTLLVLLAVTRTVHSLMEAFLQVLTIHVLQTCLCFSSDLGVMVRLVDFFFFCLNRTCFCSCPLLSSAAFYLDDHAKCDWSILQRHTHPFGRQSTESVCLRHKLQRFKGTSKSWRSPNIVGAHHYGLFSPFRDCSNRNNTSSSSSSK